MRARGDANRRSALLVVRGEAGVGKTRLVSEFATVTAADGVRTVTTAVREYANAPYTSIVEALEALGAQADLEREADDGPHVDEKARRFASTAATFAEVARASPNGVLVVLEDLHWADGGTLELLRFLAQRLAVDPITFLATYRFDSVEHEPERVRALAALERDAEDTIALEPLRGDEVDRLLRAILAQIDRTLPPAALARIRELAEGRPLFAEELLRGALERRERDGGVVNVPATIRVTVRERFASLPERDRDLLLHAAVVGRRFSAHFVAGLAGAEPVELFAALRRARDLQLIVEEHDDEAGDSFAFRHALTREAVYAELLRAEARALHARVAEGLARVEPLDVPAIAEHAWRAGDVEHAIGWNETAGDRAVAVFAYLDAARHYVRASDLATDAAQRAMLSEKAAEALYATGDVASAIDRLSMAIEALGDDPDLNRLALRRAYLLFDHGRYDDSVREARAVLERLNDEDSTLRFSAETTAAGMLTARGRPEEALAHLERADRLTARGDAAMSARFNGNYAYCLGLLGRADEARRRFAEAQSAARACDDYDVLVRALNNHANVEFAYGPIETARSLYAAGLEVSQATKNLRFFAWLSQNAALCALVAGDTPAAVDHIARAEAIRHDVGTVRRWGLATALRFSTLSTSDDPELRRQAQLELRNAARDHDAPAAAVLGGAIAYDLLRAGRADDASSLIADSIDAVLHPDVPYWFHDAATRSGDPRVRAAAREALAEVAHRDGALPARGMLAMADARDAFRRRRRDEGLARAADAVLAFRTAGWRVDEAFALELASRPSEAVALFREIGAVGEVRRLTETAAAAPRRRGESTLTAREREIAVLVAAGHTTRAIADTLVISERTVETHIAAIYRKLGVTSRGALTRLIDETAVPTQ